MNNMTIRSLFLASLALVFFQLIYVEGCHIGGLHVRKRQADTSDTDRVRDIFSVCMKNSSAVNWEGPVDYVVLHSEWYTSASAVCSPDTNNDTVECWLQEANLLVSSTSSNLNRLKHCMIRYSLNQTNTLYQGSLFDSNVVDTPDDDPMCPPVSRADFRASFEEYYENDLTDATDHTFMELDRLFDVVQQDFICPSCACTGLSDNLGALVDYALSSGLECNRCWTTRIASMTRGGSPIADTFSLSAIRDAALTPQPLCPPSSFDVNNASDVEQVLDLRVDCKPSSVEIRLHRCAIVALGLRLLEEFVIANATGPIQLQNIVPACIPKISTEGNKTDIIFSIENNLDVCGVAITENGTHLSYTYTLRTFEDNAALSGVVRYTSDYRASLTCLFEQQKTVSSFGINALQSNIMFDAGKLLGTFLVEMTLFENENFTMPFRSSQGNPPAVQVPDDIYVDIEIKANWETLLLTAKTCWVSNNASSSGSGPKINVFDHSCPVDPATNVDVHPIPTNAGFRIRFSFRSFLWVAHVEQILYLHCELSICQISAATPSCQAPECNNGTRKRRSHEQIGGESEKKTVSVGPLNLHKQQKENGIDCSENNGGCSHICANQRFQLSICMCPGGMELLDDDRKTCHKVENVVALSERNRRADETKQLVLVFVVLVCICGFIGAIMHLCR